MPKTKLLSNGNTQLPPTDGTPLLEDEISHLEQQLVDLTEQINSQTSQLEEFSDAIAALQKPAILVALGEAPTELMQQIVANASSEEQRLRQLDLACEAQKLAQTRILELERERGNLEQDLKTKQNRLHWNIYYAPYEQEYRSKYKMPATQVKAIADLQNDLIYHRNLLSKSRQIDEGWQQMQTELKRQMPWHKSAPREPHTQRWLQSVQELEEKLAQSREIDEVDFRRWLKHRVDRERAMQAIAPQIDKYNKLLADFSESLQLLQSAVAEHPELVELAERLREIDVAGLTLE